MPEFSFSAQDGEFHTGCELIQDLQGKSTYIGVWLPNIRVRETQAEALELARAGRVECAS